MTRFLGGIAAAILLIMLAGHVTLAQAQSAGSGTQDANSTETISLTPPEPLLPEPSDEASDSDGQADRYAGYYYPKPKTTEHYTSPAPTLPDSDKVRRQAFVIGLTKQLLGGQYAPYYAIFTKGSQSDKLIIVGLVDGQLDTVYRARALLATLTAVARSTSFFQQTTHPEEANFFDLMKLLGYRQITLTDGKAFAHQITID
ncbi:hypothetical protein ACFPL7_06215 [Dongia soli]|uniref:Molybdopterin-guanine dinucleotide biosynthesis protein A n=1 Tax=Dongia soli TaxID=600628 RepID=A0ABU5E861_9PROT|nr:hypothetical protein [Dongia soli]MDY0882535.1 hypothetical protein [Dongia soli]